MNARVPYLAYRQISKTDELDKLRLLRPAYNKEPRRQNAPISTAILIRAGPVRRDNLTGQFSYIKTRITAVGTVGRTPDDRSFPHGNRQLSSSTERERTPATGHQVTQVGIPRIDGSKFTSSAFPRLVFNCR